jgi:two-component system chemotaxis response regulator CheB
VSVIVVSALTRKGGQLTLQALDRGAFDFITKPDTATAEASREAILREVTPRVRALANRLEIRSILRGTGGTSSAGLKLEHAPGGSKPTTIDLEGVTGRMSRVARGLKPEMVLVGVSTGGPNALARLLPALPGNLGVPVLVVQHMPPVFTQSLAESLSSKCALKVREATDGEPVLPDTVYIAPGGRQMRLRSSSTPAAIQITDDPPENNCRPAVDYLFRSVSQQFPGRALAVILTGMGSDGTLGLRLLKRRGCLVIAQDEGSCVVYGMPKSAVEAGVVDMVLPLEAIASQVVAAVRGGGL